MGGGAKGLVRLGDRSVMGHVLARLSPQVGQVALNANGAVDQSDALGMELVPDREHVDSGPLSGILTAMTWAQGLGQTHVVTAPCDTPFLPESLVTGLKDACETHDACLAIAVGRADAYATIPHPTCALWPVALADPLRAYLADGKRRVLAFADAYGAERAEFDADRVDPFLNVNTPADLEAAQARLAGEL